VLERATIVADVIVNHRRPTIRIPRDQFVERGTQIVLYWNGTIAPNGDGVAGGANPVSYATPLAGPSPMWLKGHRTMFAGGFALGGFAQSHADPDPAMGFAKGPFAIGGFAVGGGYWQWQPTHEWRDGEYAIAARLQDALGNEQSADVAALTIEVAALPRPSSRAWINAYDEPGNLLTIAWNPSPDFAAV
jgi:hypothetical protein